MDEELRNELNIVSVETGEDVRMNLLIYGVTGVGKTTLLGSAQDCEYTSPMLLLDIEGGTLSLSGSDIDIIRPQNFGEIQDIYDFLRYDNTKYRSVGIDSVTELQRKLSMGEILGVLEEDSNYTKLDGHKPPDRYDWLQSGEQMRRFIRAFRDLAYLPDVDRRVHVILAALEKTDDKRNIVCPSLPGLLGVEIGASVDVLGRLSVQRVESEEEDGKTKLYRLLEMREFVEEESNLKYLGKARVPRRAKFSTELWQPTVDKIIKQWTER